FNLCLLDSKSNCFVSPLSVYSSLSLALCGSANKSRSELLSALHVKNAADFDATVASLGSALLSVPDGDPGRTLVLANGLFVDKAFSMKKCFTEALEHNFKVKAQEVNFVSASEAARHAINKWVADNTCQKIAELMPPDSIDSQTRLVLANAIYFKGTWKTVFHRDMTCGWPFYTLNGEEINVPMMGDTAAYPFAEFPELKASGLKIPFKA
uniref:SERPIN domain-containing protein n=1 Tax=Mesocestoides corti TaxID=53468 RepID=A0A5K3FQ87_MESCO